jgi:hypothetical protein
MQMMSVSPLKVSELANTTLTSLNDKEEEVDEQEEEEEEEEEGSWEEEETKTRVARRETKSHLPSWCAYPASTVETCQSVSVLFLQ